MPTIKIRLATRGSALALWQANHVGELIRSRFPMATVENVVISTRPDRHPGIPLEMMGGDKGLFVKEVEQAVLDGRADAAIHSLKDVPVDEATPLLEITAYPQRADSADVLLTRDGRRLADLPAGATVATSALRRQAQLLNVRPDLQVVGVRGNVDTRLKKLLAGEFDAIIMAAAGLDRLGLTDRISERFTPEQFLPAPGQGILAVQAAVGSPLAEIWTSLDNAAVRLQAEIEREIARRIGATCRSAAGCLAEIISEIEGEDNRCGNAVRARAVVCAPDGSERLIADQISPIANASQLPVTIAGNLLDQGCAKFLT